MSAQIRDKARRKAAALWHFQRIRRRSRQQAGMGAQVIVPVAELPCDDPACPGPATQITILGLDLIRRMLVIHRPVSDVTEADILAAMS
ncbi:MAG: hypothetical protein ACK41U_18405 [Paracoccus sp. (in: a-proteobacteria)]|uniref:hypothetical protein n=1 Tax=Paracoccus sp. TaxID=267 RepID=UPI0039198DD6